MSAPKGVPHEIELPKHSPQEIERQRKKVFWQQSGDDLANPTLDGMRSGCKWGAIYALTGGAVILALHCGTHRFNRMTTAGKVWLVTATGMAGFFIHSEHAIVGVEAHGARSASR
jgi:hypothetical protein